MEMGEPGVGRLECVQRRPEALGDRGVRDGSQQLAGRGQDRILRDELGRQLEVLLGEHGLLDLAEHAVGLHLQQLRPFRRHLRGVGLHRIERRQRLVDRPLQLGLQRLLSRDRLGHCRLQEHKPGQRGLLARPAPLERRLRVRQRNVVCLHRPNEITLPVNNDVAVADGLEETTKAACPYQAHKKAVLVLVQPADDRRKLGPVGLQARRDLRVLRADAGDSRIEL